MKRIILAVTAAILITIFIIASCLTTNTQLTPEALNNSEGNNRITNVETTENSGKAQEAEGEYPPYEQNCNANEAETAESTEIDSSKVSPEISIHTAENENPPTDVHPPDGRIYSDSEPPYAYIPTYTPKEPRLPITPPELED